MNREIILSNFARRPVRTAVSVLAVAIEVALILVVVGLVTGINTETGERTAGVGGDIMFQPPGASVFLGLNSASMPVSIGDLIAEMEGVEAVTPVLTQFNSQGSFEVIYGIEPESFDAVSGGFRFLSGEIFMESDEIVVDDLWAEAKEAQVGDEVGILNHRFRISGIVEHGKGARVYMDIATAQEMNGSPRQASIFFVKLDDPDMTDAMVTRLEGRFEGYPVRPLRDMVSIMMNTSVPALDAFLAVIVGIAVAIGALVIFLSMYTTISERTREIGVLRSLGASKAFVVNLILQETLWLCLAGVVLGVGASFLTAGLVEGQYPTLMILINADWVLRASILAVLSGLAGTVYPSLRAAAQDPVEALAYE